MQLPATIDSNSVGGEFGGSVDFTATRMVVASEKGGYHYHQNIDHDTNYKQQQGEWEGHNQNLF